MLFGVRGASRTLPNLKKYGFAYTKRMVSKERLVQKKSINLCKNDSKMQPKRSPGTLEDKKDASKEVLKDKI